VDIRRPRDAWCIDQQPLKALLKALDAPLPLCIRPSQGGKRPRSL
jgi:hypothetical protein